MGIYYKVEWLQQICGINFCVARAVYREKEVSKVYKLFVLKYDRTNPIWGKDISIADYSLGNYFDLKNKGLMIDYFQKKIQEVVVEEIRVVYDYIERRRIKALSAFYPNWKEIYSKLHLDMYEMEQICLLLVKLKYLQSFFITSSGICIQVKAKSSYEKFLKIFLS